MHRIVPHMLVLALDVGTSSARARVFDASGRAQAGAEGQVTYEPRTTPDGGVELDADRLLTAVTSALDGCLAGCGARATEIAAVGASVFWHSLLALDGAGRPLTAVITWADTRSAPAAAALRRAHDERRIHARTAAPLHSAFFPAKLRWLRETRPEVFARAAVWCGFGEYLHARLTGRLATSLSMASGTGLLDQTAGGWDTDMLAAAGIVAAQLPPIDDTAAPGLIAPHAARWPTLARVPWHPARRGWRVLEPGLRLPGPAAGLRSMSGRPPPSASSCPSPWARTRPRRGGSGATGSTLAARWSAGRRRRAAMCWPGAAGTWRSPATPRPSRSSPRRGRAGWARAHRASLPGRRAEPGLAAGGAGRRVGLSLDTGAVEITRALLESVGFRLSRGLRPPAPAGRR